MPEITKEVKKKVPILPGFCIGDWVLFRLDNKEEYTAQLLDYHTDGNESWIKVGDDRNRCWAWLNLRKVVFTASSGPFDPRVGQRFITDNNIWRIDHGYDC